MTRSLLLWLIFSLVCNSPLPAAEHDACNNIGYDWYSLTASELRSIGSDCQSSDYTSLNFHRADFLDLLAENKRISSTIYQTRSGTESNISARLLHMVLVEQLTPYYLHKEMQQLTYLNSEYEISNGIADKWMRGYADMTRRYDRLQSRKYK